VSLSGTIENGGKPVAGALVVVHDYQRRDQDYVSSTWETRTAVDGSFSFAVESGCYDILVSAGPQTRPSARRFCTKANHSSVLKIKLKTDPLQILHLE
jgi:hypothetical protein